MASKSLRFVRNGMMAHMGIAASLAPDTPDNAPRAYASTGGSLGQRTDFYDRAKVQVKRIRMIERRFRYARIEFNYEV